MHNPFRYFRGFITGEQSNTDTNHPTLFSSGVAALVAVLVLALAAPAAAGDNRGSAEEAQDMVARVIAYYDERGPEAAVARFNADPAPEFLDRDLYIFVIGPEGTVVAHGVDSSLLGVALASFVDADGKDFGEEIGLMASAEGAWVDYKWKNPVSGAIEQKSSWIVAHDGHIFGVGVYRP